MSYTFSRRSRGHLYTCDKRIVAVFETVIEYVDCTILCGVRNREEQNEAFRTGHSKAEWPNGKHNVIEPEQKSRAVDAAPYPIDWDDKERFYYFSGFVMGIAANLGISLRSGCDWDGDFQVKDQTLFDLVHFELT